MNSQGLDHVHAYEEELRAMHASGVTFCLFGSLGLVVGGVDLGGYHVPVADVAMPEDIENLNLAAELLASRGWSCTLWELMARLPLSKDQVAGKYYLRARRAGLTIDLTYEFDDPPCFADWMRSASLLRGIPTEQTGAILECKRRLGRAQDLRLLGMLKM